MGAGRKADLQNKETEEDQRSPGKKLQLAQELIVRGAEGTPCENRPFIAWEHASGRPETPCPDSSASVGLSGLQKELKAVGSKD